MIPRLKWTCDSPISFQTSPDDSLLHRTESVGRVLPHVKAKVIDPMGNTVPVGTPGEVCVSGYILQKGSGMCFRCGGPCADRVLV